MLWIWKMIQGENDNMDQCLHRFSFCEVKRRQERQFAPDISQSRDFRSWHFASWHQNSHLFFTHHPTLWFSFGAYKGEKKKNRWAKSNTMCFNMNSSVTSNKLECPTDIQEKLISVFPGIHESFKSLYIWRENIKTLKVMENRHGPLKACIFIFSERKVVQVLCWYKYLP